MRGGAGSSSGDIRAMAGRSRGHHGELGTDRLSPTNSPPYHRPTPQQEVNPGGSSLFLLRYGWVKGMWAGLMSGYGRGLPGDITESVG